MRTATLFVSYFNYWNKKNRLTKQTVKILMRRLIRSRLIRISTVCICMSEFTRCPKLPDFTLRDMVYLNQTRQSVLSRALVTENRLVCASVYSHTLSVRTGKAQTRLSRLSRLSFCCSSMLQVSTAHVPVHIMCCVCISILNKKRLG